MMLRFLFFTLLFVVTFCHADERPNVLLLMIDDLKPMTRDYGHEHMHTPNFDRLAEEGLRFENAYCQVPTCGASRASMMTSLYPTLRRFPDFLTRAEIDAPNQPTLPQRFREAGYVTVSNGKVFHHRDDTEERSWSEPSWRPETSGKTFYNEETAAFMETVTETRTPKGAKRPQKKVPMFEKGRVEPMESHDGLIAQKTIEDLRRLSAREEPFFIACGFAKPHLPFYSPVGTWDPYPLEEIELAAHRHRPVPEPLSFRVVKEQGAYLPMTHDLTRSLEYNSDDYHRHLRQGYYASVTHADDLTGKIFTEMETLGLDENTVVVVIGDHGWLLGEHNEWAKNQLFHEALRTAMWMKGPGIASGGAVESFVEFVDIFPTLCEMAGVPVSEETIHGRSFLPVLSNPEAEHRDHAYTRFETGDAISAKEHFYVRWNSREHGRETLLIDRKKDPHGANNVGGDPTYAGVAARMEDQVKAKIKEATSLPLPPQVKGKPIEISATVIGQTLNGVVVSHGGLRFGYSLHFVNGKPVLSVRNEGELFELSSEAPVKGKVELWAKIGPKKLTLRVNGRTTTGETSRLLAGQPVGRFSLGADPLDPVGRYESTNEFSGKLVKHELKIIERPLAPTGSHSEAILPEVRAADGVPNIVLMIADDCTWNDLGVYGGQAKTPYMEALARESMKLTRCFQAAPMCSPTRHNLYTGIYPVKSGAYPNHTFVKPGVKSVAHYLRDLGYRVALTGKTHISPRESFPFEYSAADKQRNPSFEAFEQLIVESKESGIPFCQMICSNDPHEPYTRGDPSLYPVDEIVLPDYYVDTPETREHFAKYLAEITVYDEQVGRAMQLLEKHGVAENTLLVVLSEQGSAFPFAKWTCYDAGLRSGMIVRWPGQIEPASSTDAMVEYVDMLPTFIEVAGGDIPEALEGRSLLPLLRGETDRHKDHTYGLMTTRGINAGSAFYGIRTIRSDQYRLIWNLTPEAEFRNVIHNKEFFLSWKARAETGDEDAQRWVDRYYRSPEFELYHSEKDPLELSNLIDDPEHAEIATELKRRLRAWMKDQGDLGQETEMAAPSRMVRPPKSIEIKKESL